MKATHKKTYRANLADRKWAMHFYELQQFKKKHGHYHVPQNCSDKKYMPLAWWCVQQRKLKKSTPVKLQPDRLQKLNAIGFNWSILDSRFEQNLSQLKAYRQEHGHCNVGFAENQRLAKWCTKLRLERNMKVEYLSAERIARLTKLGFTWHNLKKEKSRLNWERQFALLKEFKKKFGHCNVSFSSKNAPYAHLTYWVEWQRRNYRNKSKRLTAERIAKLNTLHFNWHPIKDGKRITDAELLNELKRLSLMRNAVPGAQFINANGKYSTSLYYSRFGSLGNARKIIKL